MNFGLNLFKNNEKSIAANIMNLEKESKLMHCQRIRDGIHKT